MRNKATRRTLGNGLGQEETRYLLFKLYGVVLKSSSDMMTSAGPMMIQTMDASPSTTFGKPVLDELKQDEDVCEEPSKLLKKCKEQRIGLTDRCHGRKFSLTTEEETL